VRDDELVTIDGRVDGDATGRAPYVNAALVVGGDGELPLGHREDFVVIAGDGKRVTIELAKNPVLEPARKASGAWSEMEKHPARPTGDFHPDGHVKLHGDWVLPGDAIRVIGYVKEHVFVPDTGGQREAPEQQISVVRAIAIGVGEEAAEDAKKAFERREREIEERKKPKPRPSDGKFTRAAILALFLGVALFVIDFASARAGTAGFGLIAVICSLLFAWRAWPTIPFPGGAADEDDTMESGPIAFVTMLLIVLTAAICFAITGEARKRAGATAASWLLFGLFPLIQILRGMLAKPRATPGYQIHLPARPLHRFVLVLGLVATWIAALVMAIPSMTAD
jgi:hypothetical protein